MFSRADAERLREGLPALDFSGATTTDPLLARYCSHYGLEVESGGLEASHQAGIMESGPYRLVCHYFKPPKSQGSVFLLHGYFDHSGLYGHLIRHCLGLGYAVVIFDLPGHGLSSGDEASIDSFARYCEALLDCLRLARAKNLARPWHVIGQSTGGAILIDSLLHHDLQRHGQFERLILLAPLLRPRNWTRSLFLFRVSRWLRRATRRRFSENSHDRAFLDFLREQDALQSRQLPRDWVLALMDYLHRFRLAQPCDTPLQIIQGTDDGTVDWANNLARLEEKFPQTHIRMVEGARHHLVNESPAYRDEVFKLITEVTMED
ncbi:MAG: alpha/beta hydrolase [Pseudohongiellaceae bacterium]